MSKHSKNCTSSSVFTYRQRQKLKGVYGTNQSRIGQDSIKKFQMCTICNNTLIEPTACDQGHLFCRSCVVEYLVKQKKKIAEQHEEVEKFQKRKEMAAREKDMEKEVAKLEAFQRYDNFTHVTGRGEQARGESEPKPVDTTTSQKEVKPIGIYQLSSRKSQLVKNAFWSLQNAPVHVDHVEQQSKTVFCPGSKHKLTLKRLRNMKLKDVEGEYMCWICSKEIRRQQIGAYKCGHAVCETCKSTKCEVCEEAAGWMAIESSCSSFAAQGRAEVKTYSHAFVV